MDIFRQPAERRRGDELLLVHCATLEPDAARAPALERLETAIGREFARRLVSALAAGAGARYRAPAP